MVHAMCQTTARWARMIPTGVPRPHPNTHCAPSKISNAMACVCGSGTASGSGDDLMIMDHNGVNTDHIDIPAMCVM